MIIVTNILILVFALTVGVADTVQGRPKAPVDYYDPHEMVKP